MGTEPLLFVEMKVCLGCSVEELCGNENTEHGSSGNTRCKTSTSACSELEKLSLSNLKNVCFEEFLLSRITRLKCDFSKKQIYYLHGINVMKCTCDFYQCLKPMFLTKGFDTCNRLTLNALNFWVRKISSLKKLKKKILTEFWTDVIVYSLICK